MGGPRRQMHLQTVPFTLGRNDLLSNIFYSGCSAVELLSIEPSLAEQSHRRTRLTRGDKHGALDRRMRGVLDFIRSRQRPEIPTVAALGDNARQAYDARLPEHRRAVHILDMLAQRMPASARSCTRAARRCAQGSLRRSRPSISSRSKRTERPRSRSEG
jgi:hypothetical protein